MKGVSREPAVNAIFFPFRSAGTLDAALLRHQEADVVLPDEAGDGFDRKTLRASDRHRRERCVADVVLAIADDLHGRHRAVAVLDDHVEPMLGEQPLLRSQMDRGVRAPWSPVEANGDAVRR